IGVQGDQYYPTRLMYAYIVSHRDQGWAEGDPITSLIGTARQVIVKSDANGVVPLTQAWTADMTGYFDVIIDYDNDGKFSWKLDELAGFQVRESGAIGNWLWLETNQNGKQAAGDQGIGGITVQWIGVNGNVLLTTPAASDGTYSFGSLSTGTYRVKF